MFFFLFSLLGTSSPLYNAILYQDASLLQSNKDKESTYYWNTLAYLTPESDTRYEDLSKESIEVQKKQAQSLFLSSADPQKITELYSRATDPQVQAYLLLSIAKHGGCSILPQLHEALILSHPLRLPLQAESALYGIGLLAHHSCDFSKEIDIITPMLHSFSTRRRKAASFALSILQPQWNAPQAILDATIREPNPAVRARLVMAAKNTKPSQEIEIKWFSDPDIHVRLAAIQAKPESEFLVELLKDQELWVVLETIRALGARGENLSRIIDAGANIDAEEKSILSNSRRFSQSLVAMDVSEEIGDLTNPKYPTEIRRKALSQITDAKNLKKFLKDKEPEIRSQAAKQYLTLHPENLDELISLLENKHTEVVEAALEHIYNTKEGALEDSVWSILEKGNSKLIYPALQALSSFTPLRDPQDAKKILDPLFTSTRVPTLLSVHRLAELMSIDTPSFPWPDDLNKNKNINIDTEYGRIQVELFVEEAPITCWQWIEQIQDPNYKPIVQNGDHRYLQLSTLDMIFDVGERNMHPIKKGSILYSPAQSQIWISMNEHPEDLGTFLVLGEINQGTEFLRQLRIQEHIQKISIAPNKP